MMPASLLECLRADGYAIIEKVIDLDEVASLLASLKDLPADSTTRVRGRQPYARRNLLDLPVIQNLAHSSPLHSVVKAILGDEAQPVRGILFDKTTEANWLVPWHQDLSIAVKERIDVPGFGPWSEKAGVVHVQPPIDVLQRMVTIRLHLDDCTIDNGPLRVVPGTHHRALTPAEIAERSAAGPHKNCIAPAGGAVIMRPIILHASSPAQSPAHRRVIHIEYAGCDLPGGLQWNASNLLR
jgi:ectoine hydroxylase-related dioxygenase (phytanoyl-CoA dioxygenase family)